jgi:hypothetical protein
MVHLADGAICSPDLEVAAPAQTVGAARVVKPTGGGQWPFQPIDLLQVGKGPDARALVRRNRHGELAITSDIDARSNEARQWLP